MSTLVTVTVIDYTAGALQSWGVWSASQEGTNASVTLPVIDAHDLADRFWRDGWHVERGFGQIVVSR